MSSPLQLRLATLLFPPLGLWLLWRSPQGIWRRLFGTLGIALYCLPYTAGVLWFCWRFCGLKFEMRGTPFPVPTFFPSVPDFDKLEASRAQHKSGASAVTQTSGGSYWTDFRGSNRDGHYNEKPILIHWPATGLKQLWKQPIGGGYASFVVAKGVAFTIEQRRQQEAVTAYDLQTGRELWAHTYDASFQEWMGGDGPRATPTWHDGKLYSLGALGDFRCLDADTGKLLWQHNILRENQCTNLMYGMSYSPLVVDDKVIVPAGMPDGSQAKTVFAYDKQAGKLAWSASHDKQAYTSPMLVTLAGERQILSVSASRITGLSPADGKVLWEFPWSVQYANSIAQPIITGTNRFVIAAGYGVGAAGVEINRSGAEFSAKELWRNKNLKNKFSSSVLWNSHLYGLDEDILVCIDAETGARKWKDGRYGYGQLLLASGHLVILCGDGDLALVKASPDKHEELARVPGIKGKTWNHPAIADGKLLVRNSVEMACFDLSVP
jgi:outer membrane protein assembly factor BamB